MRFFLCYSVLALGALVALSQAQGPTSASPSPKFRTLYNFTGGYDGGDESGGLVLDAQGNLYGVNEGAGSTVDGIAFELSPPASGPDWTLSDLFNFGYPGGFAVSNLVFDSKGNLYGITAGGGFENNGTVYELSPDGNGGWTGTTLYEFQGKPDGSDPIAGLVLDQNGNLYGTTSFGGSADGGTVFELSLLNGAWTESILHSFTGGHDGGTPQASVVLDSQGNLYGAASFGGNKECSCGTIFELSPNPEGGWTGKTLYQFTGTFTGGNPDSNLIFDQAGNLYSTTAQGGPDNDGVVFKLSPSSSGGWTEQVLHRFQGLDGRILYAGVVMDSSGNLYGTTQYGGADGDGVAYELTPTTEGEWNYSLLHTFHGTDGDYPLALVKDRNNRLFGATYGGGAYNFGTIFTITP